MGTIKKQRTDDGVIKKSQGGTSQAFYNHCVYEQMLLRSQYPNGSVDVDADDSFVDDEHESAEYKREYAKYLLQRDLSKACFGAGKD
jgi:hypothetical protein